ncbi:unnamed protein product [Gadus morhua 'NCC']
MQNRTPGYRRGDRQRGALPFTAQRAGSEPGQRRVTRSIITPPLAVTLEGLHAPRPLHVHTAVDVSDPSAVGRVATHGGAGRRHSAVRKGCGGSSDTV